MGVTLGKMVRTTIFYSLCIAIGIQVCVRCRMRLEMLAAPYLRW